MTDRAVEPVPAPTLRVMTLNLMGRQEAWPARRQVVAAMLSELRPDVICLQDVIRQEDDDQAAEILGSSYRLIHQMNRAADGSGVSIASRWPVQSVHEVDLRVTARAALFPCTVFAARIEAAPALGDVLVVNKRTSFQFGAELERELEAVAAARLIEELVATKPAHVVLASDLNAAPETASVRFWTGRQSLGGMSVCYQDAWEVTHGSEPEEAGHTFTRANPLVARGEMPFEPGRRIDYVLVRCADHGPTLEVVSCARVLDQPAGGVWPSDHYAVLAELRPH
jgi:endonuclease/exonuclease/phosphatase family metal-dependent hydrolase